MIAHSKDLLAVQEIVIASATPKPMPALVAADVEFCLVIGTAQ